MKQELYQITKNKGRSGRTLVYKLLLTFNEKSWGHRIWGQNLDYYNKGLGTCLDFHNWSRLTLKNVCRARHTTNR